MGTKVSGKEHWEASNIQVFWGEIAACEHSLQIYENEKNLMDTLEGFAGTGLLAGESVILIVSPEHRILVEKRLQAQNFDLSKLAEENRFIILDAAECLNSFMVNQWPDEQLFDNFIMELLERAQHKKRKVRAFGEMVYLLWQQGLGGATVQLEKLWCKLHEKNSFALYCAYPQSGFTQSPADSLKQICAAHSTMIDGQTRPSTEIYYRKS